MSARPCPCGAPSGRYTVAARVFYLEAASGSELASCQPCHATAQDVAARGRRAGESWAGAMANRVRVTASDLGLKTIHRRETTP